MGALSDKPFVVVDLESGRYVQNKTGHEKYNLIANHIDGRYYGYCPPYDEINIGGLGAKATDQTVEDVMVIYTTKIKGTSNRVVVAFTDSATVHRKKITDEKLERTIIENGEIIHCSYTIESDNLYNLETYPHKPVIEIRRYNPYMFRKQRFYKGKYKELDRYLIDKLEGYLKNYDFYDDERYQSEIQDDETISKSKLKDTFDIEPEYTDTGGGIAVKKNATFAKQALIDSNYQCTFDSGHTTFMTRKGVPYMEGHHLIPCTATNAQSYWDRFGKSIDCVENIVCLCPTCHRRIHFGSDEERKAIIHLLYKKQQSKLIKAGLLITEDELLDLYLS